MVKKELRTQILQIRDALEDAQRHSNSEEITKKVLASEEYQKAKKVFLFASFRSEVDTLPLTKSALNGGKEVYFPKVQCNEDGCKEMEFYRIASENDLEEGYQRIPEPKGDLENRLELLPSKISEEAKARMQLENILVLVPGTVFDEQGHRIGYGGGFYDRYLMQLEEVIRHQSTISLYKMAIAFECQMVVPGLIPVEPHDIQVDVIVTERETRRCK